MWDRAKSTQVCGCCYTCATSRCTNLRVHPHSQLHQNFDLPTSYSSSSSTQCREPKIHFDLKPRYYSIHHHHVGGPRSAKYTTSRIDTPADKFSSSPIFAAATATSLSPEIAEHRRRPPRSVSCFLPHHGAAAAPTFQSGIHIDCVTYSPRRGFAFLTFSSVGFRTHLRYARRRGKVPLGKMALVIEDFTVNEDQVKKAKDVFKSFDKKSQQTISTNDLGPAFRALNLTVNADQIKEWADLVDEEATGKIDENGFLILYGKKLKGDQDEREMREAFRILDKNKCGEIDVKDLRWLLESLGDDLTPEDIEEMIRETDTDGSGFVDFDEFYKLMCSE